MSFLIFRAVTAEIGELRKELVSRGLFMQATRIPGGCNVVADGLSRDQPLPSEWEIHSDDWETIISRYPQLQVGLMIWKVSVNKIIIRCFINIILQVDLFATPFNTKLKAFCCPFPHPEAWGVDSLSQDWNLWEAVYLFPPHALLRSVWEKLQEFKGLAIIVARPPSTDPLVVELARRAHETWQLKFPPSQTAGGKLIMDSGVESWAWTVYVLSEAN